MGIMIWEACVAFKFDWKIISGQRKIKWTTPIYWLTKYGVLLFIIMS